jgi:hypothetical protein
MENRIVSVLLGVTLVLSISRGTMSAGGFVKFGTPGITNSGLWSVPLDLTFDGQPGLAGLQLKIVASPGVMHLASAVRGDNIASATAWGFDYSVTSGGDTMIVLFWSRNLGSLKQGVYPGIVNIILSQVQTAGSGSVLLADVQSVLSDGQGTSAGIGVGAPASLSLELTQKPQAVVSQNFPNPCNPSTSIRYSVPQETRVTLKLYNALGQEVRTVLEDRTIAGTADITLTLSDLPSGTYYYRFSGEGFDQVHKILLLR